MTAELLAIARAPIDIRYYPGKTYAGSRVISRSRGIGGSRTTANEGGSRRSLPSQGGDSTARHWLYYGGDDERGDDIPTTLTRHTTTRRYVSHQLDY